MNEPKFDIGLPPPEPVMEPNPAPVEKEDFKAKALRRAQEEQMRQQQADLVKGWWMFGDGDSGDAATFDLARPDWLKAEHYDEMVKAMNSWEHWQFPDPATEPLPVGRIKSVTIRNGNVCVETDSGIYVWGAEADVILAAGYPQ